MGRITRYYRRQSHLIPLIENVEHLFQNLNHKNLNLQILNDGDYKICVYVKKQHNFIFHIEKIMTQ